LSKLLALRAFDRIGLWGAILGARKAGFWPWSGLTVVLYHRVVGMDALGPLDPELVDATPEEFERQMAFLRRHFVPVGLPEVLAAARGEERLPPNAVLVTFDDGYRDNYENALPILLRHGLKAIFFVSTSYVTERRLYWWEQVSYFIRHARRAEAQLSYPDPLALNLSDETRRAAATARINRLIKDRFDLDIDRLLADLARACDVPWSAERERELAEPTLMTWEQVRGLLDAGMAVGSHTCNHRVLETLPEAALDLELVDSRRELQSRLGQTIESIAYPVGRSIARWRPIRAALRRAGYEVGFTATPGINRFRGDDLYDLKRLPIDRGTSGFASRAHLAVPWLAR
jgi:peptidoglycan/xylan/chitin deacetylase (PgdA/CDA1 family)